jgi:hypothetical protein
VPGCSTGFKQEPIAPLCAVDEGFEQAGSSRVIVFVGNCVYLAHRSCEHLVVVHRLAQHVLGGDKFFVVILDALMPGDITNGAQGGAADLPILRTRSASSSVVVRICWTCSSSSRW